MAECGAARRAMVVEDEDVVRCLLVRLLKHERFEVVAVASAEEALATYEGSAAAPDVVITDVVLPGMNGRELVDKLRERHGDVRAVYMSGYARESLPLRGVLDEGSLFLRKPFRIVDVIRLVEEALAGSGSA